MPLPSAGGNLKSRFWLEGHKGPRAGSPATRALLCGPLSSFSLLRSQGGIILVSHDECFIRLVCQELWVCENATVTRIEGGFDQYRDILKEQFRKEGFL